MIYIILITSCTQNRKLDPRYLIPVHALLRVPITLKYFSLYFSNSGMQGAFIIIF